MSTVAVSGCGGGDTTTVIERVERPVKETASPDVVESTAKPALLGMPAAERWQIEPVDYSFAGDGSFAGTHLIWEGWGSPTATGTGVIYERDFNGGPGDHRDYPGAVVATALEECRGRDYYTEVSAEVPANAIFVPEEATQLSTPCRPLPPISGEQEPKEAEDSESAQRASFYTPSHNIACGLSDDSVRCDIRHKTWTPPPKPGDCMNDWGHSVSAGVGEAGHVLCAGDTLLTGDYGELPYGRRITRGAMTCLSKEEGLTCTNGSGEGFFLSVNKLRLF